jgi:DNA-binding LytR/AlgR family response regulator
LREAAFDFLLKPPKEIELKEAVQRFLAQRNQPLATKAQTPGKILNQMVALPTNKGLQFFPKADIVCVECQKTNLGIRSTWVVLLNNRQTIRLRPNSNAGSIINHLGSDHFIPLSQSVIVNIAYVSMVEYKTNCCYLFPPFDEKPVKISRQYMAVLRERFDVI